VERERLERIHERFLRWVLGVAGRTTGYMVKEELQKKRLRNRAGKRALDYEEKLRGGGGNIWAQWCLKDMKERALRGGELSEGKRKKVVFCGKRDGYKEMGDAEDGGGGQ